MTPTENAPRVLRGGCWNNNVASWERAASRGTVVPANRFNFIGFRCALRGRQPL